jgi:hypothetical protein
MINEYQAALEVQAVLDELENKGLLERTGEMRWCERLRTWEPVYAQTELGCAWYAAGITLEENQKRAS